MGIYDQKLILFPFCSNKREDLDFGFGPSFFRLSVAVDMSCLIRYSFCSSKHKKTYSSLISRTVKAMAIENAI
jgi:hypothetical protein